MLTLPIGEDGVGPGETIELEMIVEKELVLRVVVVDLRQQLTVLRLRLLPADLPVPGARLSLDIDVSRQLALPTDDEVDRDEQVVLRGTVNLLGHIVEAGKHVNRLNPKIVAFHEHFRLLRDELRPVEFLVVDEVHVVEIRLELRMHVDHVLRLLVLV